MPEVTFTISRNLEQQGEYHVVVDGTGFYEQENMPVSIRVRGSDKWYDDSLFGMPDFEVRVLGGAFNIGKSVPGNALNEDWGEDDVYALVKVGNHPEIKTNTIKGDFG
jgi:hypothetical protein